MKTQQGFIKWILLLVVAVVILSYYGFDIQKAIESPTTQSNFNYLQKIAWNVWNFLKPFVMALIHSLDR